MSQENPIGVRLLIQAEKLGKYQDYLTDMEEGVVDNSHAIDERLATDDLEITTGGTRIRIQEDEEIPGEGSFDVLGRSQTKQDTEWLIEVVNFLFGLQKLVKRFLPTGDFLVYTEHQRGEILFHSHPNFQGRGYWRDWALLDWGPGYGIVPVHIWCFLELPLLPSGRDKLQYGGIDLESGTYAVVESSKYSEDEDEVYSDLFTPITMEVCQNEEGQVTGRKFYLASCNAIVAPCIVVPDYGGQPNAYFQVKNRSAWVKDFRNWVNSPHDQDKMDFDSEEENSQVEAVKTVAAKRKSATKKSPGHAKKNKSETGKNR